MRERQLAERQYLKEYAQEWMESQTDETKRVQFNHLHPRFANLVKGPGPIIHIQKSFMLMKIVCGGEEEF